jgi:uncharacterized protein YndB with AHSA1/START domain
MTAVDTTVRTQSEAISFEFDLQHAPEKVWRALSDPELLSQWLLPVVGLTFELGRHSRCRRHRSPVGTAP